jgi:hypothetical protein
MRTIVDKDTGKVLYCRLDAPTLDNEVAIDAVFNDEVTEGYDLYWDFKKKMFYEKINDYDTIQENPKSRS